MLDIFVPAGDRLEYIRACAADAIPEEAVWIDLMHPSREEELAAEAFLGAGLPTREEMQEIEPSSRLGVEGGALYLTAVLPCRSESNEPTTTAVSFVLGEKHLATVRYDEPGTLPLARQRLLKSGAGAVNATSALIVLLEAAIDRLADIVEWTGARIEAIARHVFTRVPAGSRRDSDRYDTALHNIGHEGMRLGHIEESLISMQRLMLYLVEKADGWGFQKDDRARMKTMLRDLQGLSDHCRGLEDRTTFILDATLGLISIEQNATIKIFSVLAVVFMPPTLVASIYGMNFDVMPELHWTIGYPFALLLMVASAVITFAVFRWRGWL
jgi:magnesium transporter